MLLPALLLLAPPTPDPDGSAGVEVAPAELLYEPHVADPRRPTFSLVNLSVSDSEIPGAGDSRNGLRIGTRFGLVRFGDPERPFQLEAEVGFLGQFDRDNSTDNIGWDGVFAFDLAWLPREDLALRFGWWHDSAHLGDEYVESTGATRIDYTRQELRLGAAYRFHPEWRTYAEYGWAFDLRNEALQEEGRLQSGLEYESRLAVRGLHPFAAVDVSFFEEDEWQTNVNLQAGLALHRDHGATWRFGLVFYDGRSVMGELFQSQETHLGLGIWIDP